MQTTGNFQEKENQIRFSRKMSKKKPPTLGNQICRQMKQRKTCIRMMRKEKYIEEKHITSSVNHGGFSVTSWACMAAMNGLTGDRSNKMNSELYIYIYLKD